LPTKLSFGYGAAGKKFEKFPYDILSKNSKRFNQRLLKAGCFVQCKYCPAVCPFHVRIIVRTPVARLKGHYSRTPCFFYTKG
jgi:predicted aldo/keto reductase-like oxidoreductase